jgi:hypothetical protein
MIWKRLMKLTANFLALWALCALVFPPVMAVAAENPATAGAGETVVHFDIPAQPLEDALYAFGNVTGISIFADGNAVAGRRSTAVEGAFTVTQALRILLAGTGLDVRPMGARAITLSLSQPHSDALAYRRYSAALQNAALRRLCSDTETSPGSYRLAMELWLDDIGRVQRIELLSSTSDLTRDRRLRELMEGLSVGKPPPMLPQPVIMVILPRSPRDSGDCG